MLAVSRLRTVPLLSGSPLVVARRRRLGGLPRGCGSALAVTLLLVVAAGRVALVLLTVTAAVAATVAALLLLLVIAAAVALLSSVATPVATAALGTMDATQPGSCKTEIVSTNMAWIQTTVW